MPTSASVLADSLSPEGVRLTSFKLTYPRIIHAEMCRHRMHSRCVSSSRAIPVQRFVEQVELDPYTPTHWGKNQKGMQAHQELTAEEANRAEIVWLRARDYAVHQAKALLDIGLHKQLTNRLLEPWMWVTEVVTATEWDNFFHLRCHPDAHPEIRLLAEAMREAMCVSRPARLGYEEWHLPFISEEDRESFQDSDPAALPSGELLLCSIGRCARVSYLTHDGRRDVTEDVALARRLLDSGHMSPFEHVASPMSPLQLERRIRWRYVVEGGQEAWISRGTVERPPLDVGEILWGRVIEEVLGWQAFEGNLNGWMSYRKTIPGEHDMLGGG